MFEEGVKNYFFILFLIRKEWSEIALEIIIKDISSIEE